MNVQLSKFPSHYSLATQILRLLLLILLLRATTPVFAQENFIANPGFEEESENEPADWTSFGDVEWVTDELHSGERAIKLYAEGDSSGIKSSPFEVPVDARVEVSAFLRAQDVVSPGSYFKLRMTLSAYEADQTTKIKHWDLVSTTGSFEWKEVKASVIVPPETKYMRLAVQLTECTGTVWVDDVVVKISQTIPDVPATSAGEQGPIIIPQPRQMRVSKEKLSLGTIGIVSHRGDDTLKEAIARYFDAQGISFLFVSADDPIAPFTTLLILGDESQPILDERFQRLSSGSTWSNLGQEGYFLSVAKGQKVTIYVGANSEQGRFYALQTMKQLLLHDNQEDKQIYVADIVDRPTLSRRGIPMGLQWYNQQIEVFNRLAQLKLNFVWNQGTFENQKLWYRWREPLVESEKERLRAYLILARKHFIRPYIAIGPRGREPSEPTYYSSETDINLVVDKMVVLYDLGVRHFGLTFDDLGNFGQDILFGEDIAFFNNDIGAAHYHFVKEVHERLKARHPDIKFMVIPMIYSDLGNRGDTELSYLASLAQLSPEIEMYSSPAYPEEALTANRLTNRRPLMWDNFWANYYQSYPAPEFVVPLDRSGSFDQSLITGFTFLPLIPTLEDASLVSWKTAADYAWAPERYNPELSFQLASTQYMKSTDQVDTLAEPAKVAEGEVLIETPIIAPSMGTFLDSVTVELTTTTAGSTIHYTFDGTRPTSTSPKYSQPFTLTHSTRVKAKAFDEGGNDSGVSDVFFAISPATSRLYLPIVQAAQPIQSGFNPQIGKPDQAVVGPLSWKRWLSIGTLLLVIAVSTLIWYTTGGPSKKNIMIIEIYQPNQLKPT